MLPFLLLQLVVLAIVPAATTITTGQRPRSRAYNTEPFSVETWAQAISENPTGNHLSPREATEAAIARPFRRGDPHIGADHPSSIWARITSSLLSRRQKINPHWKGQNRNDAGKGIGVQNVICNTFPQDKSRVEAAVRCIKFLAMDGSGNCQASVVSSFCKSGNTFIVGWKKMREMTVATPKCNEIARSAGRIMDFCSMNGRVMGQTVAWSDPGTGVMIRDFGKGELDLNYTLDVLHQ